MKKYVVLLILMLVVASGLSCKKTAKGGDPAKPLPPKKVKVVRGPMELKVASTGNIVSNLDVEIKCKASGQVVKLPFDISDTVKKGDLLVELDPIDEQRNLEKAQVALTAAQSNYEKAKLDITIAENNLASARKKAEVAVEAAKARAKDEQSKADRVKQLFDKKLAGQEELDTAQTSASNAQADLKNAMIALDDIKTQEESLKLKKEDLKISKTNVDSSKINLSIAQQRIADTKVFSPIDGVITSRLVQTGQIISSGISSTSGGTTVMVVSDLSKIFVLASVDESDIGEVGNKMPVNITADAYQDKKFTGIVDRIAPSGINQSNVVTFEVRIEVLSDNKSLLKPQMTANVDIIAASKDDVLSVPIGAVSREKEKYFVTVVNAAGTEEKREVKTGLNDGESFEITSGLAEGDTVLVKQTTQSQWQNGGGPQRGGAANPMRMMGGGPPH